MSTEKEIPSPCIQYCQLDHSKNICMGCFRTLQEIAAWGDLNEDQKREVLLNSKKRKIREKNN